MMTKPMWNYMNYYKSIDTTMSWKKIIYKADVSTRLFQIGMWMYLMQLSLTEYMSLKFLERENSPW